MIDFTELLIHLLRISATFSALCIPAVSVAYFIVANAEEEAQKRMASTITLGCLAGIVFVANTLVALFFLLSDLCQTHWWVVVIGFVIGCSVIVLVFLTLAGVIVKIGRKMPSFKNKKK